ncbi:hypothetical protein C1701_24895 [Actinoalloteichus sp. AHMU CJ021]|uniref:Uncharacterized protein n=1 Tax=Actinoalloteichus caeruleus DSM 43889 TaxID=1120930 RepID=A0ABT1JDD7_ACTCY|nr:hypothetical protein [Actinoalloteichus caeruleus]AUS81039.1 hypothetical protein C1701_24895 [Actinoalloteichus sp. AHMU CJ021]MCP2330517.1 hypothetical protein [Actinoalloteichus caeruleus DSM 43889]
MTTPTTPSRALPPPLRLAAFAAATALVFAGGLGLGHTLGAPPDHAEHPPATSPSPHDGHPRH